jgi:hypothetical protein
MFYVSDWISGVHSYVLRLRCNFNVWIVFSHCAEPGALCPGHNLIVKSHPCTCN